MSVSSVFGVFLNLFVMFIVLIAKVKLPGHQVGPTNVVVGNLYYLDACYLATLECYLATPECYLATPECYLATTYITWMFANCLFQNIFMFNLAVSNLILSLLGVFRGLGIMFPIFVIAGDNNRPNSLCGAFAIALNTLG